MTNKRSYLDSLNAGRQRRSYATLEQLNRSLETLEQRIDRNREEMTDYARASGRRPSSNPYLPDADRETFTQRPPQPAERRSHYDQQPYQSIARDIERVRGQEEGVAAFGKIANELKGLREEMRHQMTSGVRREFETLRQDLERASLAGSGKATGKLGLEFERLSGAIAALAERSDDRSTNMLRLEVEQMRQALDTLAREDTVRSVDRRWDDFDRRFHEFEDRVTASAGQRPVDPMIAALTQRLEQIGEAVSSLPQSLSLNSLEDKVRTLSGALDHFIGQQGGRVSDTFVQIEERLDEISRAVVAATVAAQSPHIDLEPFERIEARISALARQIEDVADDRPTAEVIERLNVLSERVDDMAARSVMPDASIDRLARQISAIADKVERSPVAPDTSEIFVGIERRFDALSSIIERRQSDAMEQGQALFRELERRLDDVADRLDQRQADAALDSSGIMGAIEARFSALAQKLDDDSRDGASDEAMRIIEARLDDISGRLDASAGQFSGIDPDLIRSLEAQVAGLSGHLNRPATPLPAFEDIGPRLSEIEKSIAGSRETVLEAARHAAENAAKALAGSNQVESVAVAGLADDLKSLEDLTRRSDERNGRTFEAIHDTLLKIVDRLGSLETEGRSADTDEPEAGIPAPKTVLHNLPPMDADPFEPIEPTEDLTPLVQPTARTSVERSPAQAAAAAAVAAMDAESGAGIEQGGRMRSLLGGIGRALGGKKAAPQATEPALVGSELPADEEQQAPVVDLDEPLDPKIANRPLEPGSGAPDLSAIMKRVRDERGQPIKHSETDTAKSDFIAAARRAAKAAAAEAEVLKRNSDINGPVKALRVGDLLKARRKPILMAAAAIMIALAGLQLGKVFMKDVGEAVAYEEPAIVAEQQFDTASLDSTPESEEAADQIVDDAIAMAEPADDVREVMPRDDLVAAAPATPQAIPEEMAQPTVPAQIVEAPVSPAATAAPVAIVVPDAAGPLPLREAASAGDAKALFEVASRYAEGRGVKADMAEAAKWYERAADLGLAPAQYRIGNFYEKGIGVTRDIAKSKSYYQLAADQGNASAMHNLAVLFAMGADGTSDNDEAARWFIRAADLGVKDSQFNLGILAAKGVGMQQNLEESYKWFALVAKTGDKDAASKRDEIANSLRPEQLERARAATELWKPKEVDPEANSVEIPESWQESPDQTASVDMGKAVQNVQLILNKNGYDAGKPDGVMGGKTKTAIVAFQKANDLPETGEIDGPLVKKLLDRK